MTFELSVRDLRICGLAEPLGIPTQGPALGWKIVSRERDVIQAAYEVRCSGEEGSTWDTGQILSHRSTFVPLGGPLLRPASRYTWQVRVWDTEGRRSDWSPVASWETGLDPDGWGAASWISYPGDEEVTEPPFPRERPAVHYRSTIELPARPVRARAYATALGVYELWVAGQRLDGDRLMPGWTDYRARVVHQTFDVTDILPKGPSAICAVVADGWYAGHVGMFGRGLYGERPALLVHVEAELPDGTVVRSSSGPHWRAAPGPTLSADLLHGERQDLRLEPRGWLAADFDDTGWDRAWSRAPFGGIVVPQATEGIKVVEELEPIEITTTADGAMIVDFGENVAGCVRLDVGDGAAGEELELRHGEVLEPDGTLYTANLRSAEQHDRYTLSEAGATLEPRFTYHGFRYAEVRGALARVRRETLRARVLSSAVRRTGWFECSDPMLTALQRNIVRSQVGNFLGVPTDCPQRDERLGWTCDVRVFAATAAFNFDVLPFLRQWLVDLEGGQLPSGAYADVAPTVGNLDSGNAGWADAGVLVPWTLYECYGDQGVLEAQYQSMTRFASYLELDSTNGIRHGGRYGDWVSLAAHTPKDLIGTAFACHTFATMAKIAAVIGREADVARYAGLFERGRSAFRHRFLKEDGAVAGGTQTAYLLTLHMDLAPDELRAAIVQRLVADIETRGQLTTGFLGTPIALPTLSANGQHELACRLAQKQTFPSWGFQVRHGATSVWERWDGWSPEHGWKDAMMNSFNHYAFGSIGEWLYRTVGGLALAPDGAGFSKCLIAPQPGGTITSATTRYETPHGPTTVAWKLDHASFVLDVELPPNTTGIVRLPVLGARDFTTGTRPEQTIGSGTHSFELPMARV